MVTLMNHDTESTCVSDIYELQCLAHQLRRGPSGSQLKLKRAFSCPCLMEQNNLPFPAFQPNPRLKRYCSAPDFTITESISSLHPCLIDLLNISRFYCNEKQHNNFLMQQFENSINDELYYEFLAARRWNADRLNLMLLPFCQVNLNLILVQKDLPCNLTKKTKYCM